MPPSTLVLATRNADKLREISSILAPFTGAAIISLDEAGLTEHPDEESVESFDTFVGNARAKARYFSRITNMPAIADDSGICVDALDGRPGVWSKRFADAPHLAGAELDAANNERLLLELRNVTDERRTAHYTCVAALELTDGRTFAAVGTCSGTILHTPRGTGGFGYDPLFLLPDLDCTFAEMSPEMKHRFSHRGRAFRALGSMLDRVL